MYENYVGGFDCPICPHPGCGPISIYTRIKLYEK